MTGKFRGLKVRPYQFREPGGSSREVLAIHAGGKPVAFIEYDVARKFVDRIHDLCDDHDRAIREWNRHD